MVNEVLYPCALNKGLALWKPGFGAAAQAACLAKTSGISRFYSETLGPHTSVQGPKSLLFNNMYIRLGFWCFQLDLHFVERTDIGLGRGHHRVLIGAASGKGVPLL